MFADLQLRHITPDCHSDIDMHTKARASHFIAWVKDHPVVIDDHGNEVTIRASFIATPQERAMGSILSAAYTHISSRPGYIHKTHCLQTNKKNGTLSIRDKGRAFVLLQVLLLRKGAPDVAPQVRKKEILPDSFPGIADAEVDAAIALAIGKMATMSF